MFHYKFVETIRKLIPFLGAGGWRLTTYQDKARLVVTAPTCIWVKSVVSVTSANKPNKYSLPHSVSVSASLCLSVSLCLCLCLSLCLSLSVCLSLCLSVSLSSIICNEQMAEEPLPHPTPPKSSNCVLHSNPLE